MKWYTSKGNPTNYYATRVCWIKEKREYRRLWLHRLVMYAEDGMKIDHINGNGLDNRKANLRFVTTSQNGFNRFKKLNSISSFKGISFCPQKKKRPWRVMIQTNKKNLYIGQFDTQEEAARAYDRTARELHGEYARLNFPDEKCS